ncbi:hypothetical protein MMC22_000875 [Lobaria immixta]|nr:hypothetical protein [Lobaria immixta]
MSPPLSQAPSPASQSHEDYDEDAGTSHDEQPSPHQQAPQQTSSLVGVVGAGDAASTQPPKPLGQKRRRVTRAYDCTYNQPSNRRRNPAPQYIEALETRLQRAETLLKTVLPDVDLDDPNFDAGVPQRMHGSVKQESSPVTVQGLSLSSSSNLHLTEEVENESLLESMVENTGSLDLDDQGYWDYHGHSSGLVFLRRMREQFGDLMGKSEGYGFPTLKARNLHLALESPKSNGESPLESNLPNTHDLPTKDCARSLCGYALDDACALMRFVHQPTFYTMLDRIYDVQPEYFGNEENRFLPLLYAVMALGCLFAKAEDSQLQINGYESAIDQGQFFRASRQLMEITDCRDLTSLQTILFMIMFLQSSANLSTCYSHIGIALTSSIRMGLHRSVPVTFNPVERETRKRIFSVIRKMDTYVAALLGLPKLVSDDEIDQEMPIEVDDEFITTEKIRPMPLRRISVMAAFNAHSRLVQILAKTAKYIYPNKNLAHAHSKSRHSYMVSHAKIREIEQDLQEWMEKLPMALRPGGEAPPELARIQQLLRMAYAHVHMFLYRPFLHYVSQNLESKTIDKRSYACAAACVSVSRNIIHCTSEMKRRGLLVGAYWFYMYTTFFAIISLVFFALENPQSSTSKEILRDASEGKDALASLAKRSMAADRCSLTLAELFEHLPEKLKAVGIHPPPQKKRPSSSNNNLSKAQSTCSDTERVSPPMLHASGADRIQHSSSSPRANIRAKKRASLPHDSVLRRRPISGIDTDLQVNSNEGYHGSSGPENIGLQTPESISGRACPSVSTPLISGSPGLSSNGFPDLSAMMFPSADPFAYPNQPMTTLESRSFIKSEDCFDANMYDLTNTSIAGGPYDNPDAQIYGQLPPYLMQGQQPGSGLQNASPPLDMNFMGPDSNILAMNDGSDGWTGQQARTGGAQRMNVDQIFGENWSGGWINSGYAQ